MAGADAAPVPVAWGVVLGGESALADYSREKGGIVMPQACRRPRGSVWERFHTKFIPVTESGCWIWMSEISNNGYGRMRDSYKVKRMAHRIAWELYFGPIQEDLEIDHLCRVRCCVNPAHLEPVTARINIFRGNGGWLKNKSKTHCPQGHPYSGGNLIAERRSRRCRTCHNHHQRAKKILTGLKEAL